MNASRATRRPRHRRGGDRAGGAHARVVRRILQIQVASVTGTHQRDRTTLASLPVDPARAGGEGRVPMAGHSSGARPDPAPRRAVAGAGAPRAALTACWALCSSARQPNRSRRARPRGVRRASARGAGARGSRDGGIARRRDGGRRAWQATQGTACERRSCAKIGARASPRAEATRPRLSVHARCMTVGHARTRRSRGSADGALVDAIHRACPRVDAVMARHRRAARAAQPRVPRAAAGRRWPDGGVGGLQVSDLTRDLVEAPGIEPGSA